MQISCLWIEMKCFFIPRKCPVESSHLGLGIIIDESIVMDGRLKSLKTTCYFEIGIFKPVS